MLIQVLLLLISFLILYYGAEWTLNSAEKIGEYAKLSPLVIGLLIIGFGTSLPELFVSHIAAASNEGDIALGNIVGSNVANLFLILGVSGLITPLSVAKKEFEKQTIFHLLITLALAITITQDNITLWTTLGLTIFFVAYIYFSYKAMTQKRLGKSIETAMVDIPRVSERTPISPWEFVRLIIGFFMLWAGSKILVQSGSKLGEIWGLSTYIISAFVVALGTSFPELITALFACIKKKDTDLILGNIIGSNIFNVSFVLSGLGLYNLPVRLNATYELIFLVIGSLILLGLSLTKKNFHRAFGLVFLTFYGVVVSLWL
jgi:cation:H+ antiporter